MRLFGYEVAITKALPPLSPLRPLASGGPGGGGWFPFTVRDPYPGAWQLNDELRPETALSYFAVFACVTLIASDIAKLRLRLVEQDADGVWSETTNPAYSPVLRTPNRYQTIIKFVERWIISKLVAGNTYVLKQRDARGVVVALYVLDPARVTPLVSSDGGVYYRLTTDVLTGVDGEGVTVPASEILHDLMCPIFHPLCGVTPLYACGLSALQGQTIQRTSSSFFANGSQPGGVLTAPGKILDETAQRLKDYWTANFTGSKAGAVAVLGDGLKYEGMTVNAVDSQLIDQLKWTADTICSCFHVPAYMIGVGPPPPYANVEPLLQQYYSQCIQSLLASFEATLDRGLEFATPRIGTEFDIMDLMWMDTATRTKAATDAIGGSAMSPNEARFRYFGLGPVPGGAAPLAQQQYYSLEALAQRDAGDPFAKPAPAPVVAPAPVPVTKDVPELLAAALLGTAFRADYTALEGATMTEAELLLMAKTLAPIVREIVLETKAQQRADLLALEGTLRERLAALEAREPVAGPPGPPGPPGRDGQDGPPGLHGKDGTAGLTYRGVFLAGQDYAPGDLVTWSGSTWHCNAATTAKPGEAAADWTLMVKRGRDGKDVGRS